MERFQSKYVVTHITTFFELRYSCQVFLLTKRVKLSSGYAIHATLKTFITQQTIIPTKYAGEYNNNLSS